MSASKNSFASVSNDSEQAGEFFETLFGRSRTEFFRQSSRRGVILAHGPIRRLGPLLKNGLIDNRHSLHTLAINYSQSIRRGFLSNDGILDYRELNQTEREQIVSSRVGLFLFDGLEQHFKALLLMLLQACKEFGYATFGARCLGFFHTPGINLPRHCDELDVVVIQLFGSRRWWVERNADPPVGILDPLRASCLRSEVVDPKFGDSTRVLELRPGSVLYVPAGYWHQTYSRTSSFSVTLGLPGTVAEMMRRQKNAG